MVLEMQPGKDEDGSKGSRPQKLGTGSALHLRIRSSDLIRIEMSQLTGEFSGHKNLQWQVGWM